MLRNIPNRVDQAMLKALLDITSYGRYDFMYLRIDFANNCNVGYAFINFTDAQSIVPFVLARAGKRWNCFASDKIAEVSYASKSSPLTPRWPLLTVSLSDSRQGLPRSEVPQLFRHA